MNLFQLLSKLSHYKLLMHHQLYSILFVLLLLLVDVGLAITCKRVTSNSLPSVKRFRTFQNKDLSIIKAVGF